jgi:DNA gyrase subunit A
MDEMEEEDFIQREEVTITMTSSGYIKRMPITNYRTQRRGGKGKIGINTKEEDVVTNILTTNTHDHLLFFTNKGIAYRLKAYKIPESASQSLGRAIVNLLPIAKDEKITAILPIKEGHEDDNIVFATAKGSIRRNKLSDFASIPTKGKIAMKLDETDSLIGVLIANETQDILISTSFGLSTRFPLESLRVFSSRNSSGVRAIVLSKGDYVINASLLQHEKLEDIETREQYLKYAMAKRREGREEIKSAQGGVVVEAKQVVAKKDEEFSEIQLSNEALLDLEAREEFILTVTSNGYGKRTSAYEYRITNRGGKGFLGGKLSDKNGDIVANFTVESDDEIIVVSSKGQVIRQNVKDIRITGRVAVGVILFKLDKDEKVVSVSKVKTIKEDIDSEASDVDGLNNNE